MGRVALVAARAARCAPARSCTRALSCDAREGRLALVFPGQGTHYPGMGKDLGAEFRAARLAFEEVDEALGMFLSRTMFDGLESDLRPTEVAQPAIMAHSMAVLRVLEADGGLLVERGGDVVCVLGHSLGEFTSLAACGALPLAAAARLVRARGLAMARAHRVARVPGAMLAMLQPEPEAVRALCRGAAAATGQHCVVANYNAPSQLVVSGGADAIDFVESRHQQAAAARRCTRLRVGAAFHSPYMWPAAAEVARRLGAPLDELRAAAAAELLPAPRAGPATTTAAVVAGASSPDVGADALVRAALQAIDSRDGQAGGVPSSSGEEEAEHGDDAALARVLAEGTALPLHCASLEQLRRIVRGSAPGAAGSGGAGGAVAAERAAAPARARAGAPSSARLQLRDPVVPLICNATACEAADKETLARALAIQPVAPVYWSHSVARAAHLGATRALELGPGKAQTGLIRHIGVPLPCTPAGDVAGVRALLASSLR